MKLFQASKPTATWAIRILEEAGIFEGTTGRRRDLSSVYQFYLNLLRVGTELGSSR